MSTQGRTQPVWVADKLCDNILHKCIWYRVVSVPNHKLGVIIVTNRLRSVYLFVSPTCLYTLLCHHNTPQKHHRLIISFIPFGSHRITITTHHHLMLCCDCQESIASARTPSSSFYSMLTYPLTQSSYMVIPYFNVYWWRTWSNCKKTIWREFI